MPEIVSVAPGWLLLEFIERGVGGEGYSRTLGIELAELHARTAGAEHGDPDNFIGSLPQRNDPCIDWATF